MGIFFYFLYIKVELYQHWDLCIFPVPKGKIVFHVKWILVFMPLRCQQSWSIFSVQFSWIIYCIWMFNSIKLTLLLTYIDNIASQFCSPSSSFLLSPFLLPHTLYISAGSCWYTSRFLLNCLLITEPINIIFKYSSVLSKIIVNVLLIYWIYRATVVSFSGQDSFW